MPVASVANSPMMKRAGGSGHPRGPLELDELGDVLEAEQRETDDER